MGIDATILVATTRAETPDGIKFDDTPDDYYVEARELEWYWGGVHGLKVNEGERVLSLDTDLSRYFHEDYPRGDWPFLRGLITKAQEAFPDGRVYYGGDGEFVTEATPEFLAETDAQWDRVVASRTGGS